MTPFEVFIHLDSITSFALFEKYKKDLLFHVLFFVTQHSLIVWGRQVLLGYPLAVSCQWMKATSQTHLHPPEDNFD